ncbi:MAG TPA: M48 family metalloprotease [Thermoanaerobaculia bacterium]|nr:M48 family metalloprotease [Thermoanaerobaculia bacterium]
MSRRPLAAAVAALLLRAGSAAPLAAQAVSDPDLFGKSLKVAHEALVHYGAYDNESELERVNRVGYELAQHATSQKFPFTFGLVDVPVPNAFALPGGQIFVTRGMLDLGLSDDMLANLLGHEIAHVTLTHYKRMQRKAALMNVLSTMLIAGVVIGSEGRRDDRGPAPYDPRRPEPDPRANLVQGAAAASLIVSELLLRSYSREHETEADEEGQRLAAAAGYDPIGARQLWQMMLDRFPRAKEYGYWQTHPFPDERLRAADVRRGLLTVAARRASDDYRLRTQAALLSYLDRHDPAREETEFLEAAALLTWPQGKAADGLRREALEDERDAELAKPLMSRDYGRLVAAYKKEIETVRRLTPGSPLVAELQREVDGFREALNGIYPKAQEVLAGGVYETSFLTGFLSNFPDAPEAPKVALALGDAYARLDNATGAVEQYLRAWERDPEGASGRRAAGGLRALAPALEQLAALQQLVDQGRDPELQRLAAERLAKIAPSYGELANGAEYLRRFPEGAHVPAVLGRLDALADNLYGEVVLYQGVGDNVKALERMNSILTHAPLSPAAERLRDRAVLDLRS